MPVKRHRLKQWDYETVLRHPDQIIQHVCLLWQGVYGLVSVIRQKRAEIYSGKTEKEMKQKQFRTYNSDPMYIKLNLEITNRLLRPESDFDRYLIQND